MSEPFALLVDICKKHPSETCSIIEELMPWQTLIKYLSSYDDKQRRGWKSNNADSYMRDNAAANGLLYLGYSRRDGKLYFIWSGP